MRRVSVIVAAPWLLTVSYFFSSVIAAAPEVVDREQPAAGQTLAAEGPAAPEPPVPDEVSPEEAAARKAAEAELEAAKGFTKRAWDRDEQAALKWLEHAEAACRLDPTFEEAAYERIQALNTLCFGFAQSHRTPENLGRTFTLALEYVERFGVENRDHAGMVHDRVRVAIALAGGLSNDTPRLAPVHVEHVETLKRLLIHALDHDLHGPTPDYHHYMLSVIYRAKVQTGVAIDQRERWVDDMLARADRQSERLRKGENPDRRTYHLANYMWMRFRAIELALADGRRERARTIWARVQELYQHQAPSGGGDLDWMRTVLTRADEGEWLAEFDRWRKEWAARVVSLLTVRFPEIDVHGGPDLRGVAVPGQRGDVSSLSVRVVARPGGRGRERLRPLAVGDGVLYVCMQVGMELDVVGSIPLDATERPVGRPAFVRGDGLEYTGQDGARLLPPAPFQRRYETIHVARYMHGKLCLTTRESGLLIFDAKTEEWTAYGPEQGLPGAEVVSVIPLDERTLFGSSRGEKHSHFTLDLADGTVRVLRTDDREQRPICAPLHDVWRHDGKLMGWDYGRLWTDLLAPDATVRPCLDGKVAYGWREQWRGGIDISAGLEPAGRRFIAGPSGLHEFDVTGRVVQSWWSAHSITPAGVRHSIDVPPTSPVYHDNHVVAGDLIYSTHQQKTVAYQPATDTWYGPLLVSIGHAPCGTREGVWGGSLNGIGYVRNEDFVAKAEEAGRVMTTAEFLVRRDALIEALPALERAKVYFAMRRFDEARALLEEIVRAEPRHAEALMLSGWLNDDWCTNRPDDARGYYRRLAAMEDNADACFSGHYMEFLMLGREKQWKELIELGDRIAGRFPQIEEYTQGNIDSWRNHARKRLAEAE